MDRVPHIDGRGIRVRGLVQGVGFRPTVWRLARDFGLAGDVRNDGAGVRIRVWGDDHTLDRFVAALAEQAPPLSRIDDIAWEQLSDHSPGPDFRIAASVADTAETGVVPDAAICPACRDDISDPANRRYRYPFTNCTHCGPRLTIVSAIPYDRAHTSMAAFPMCPECRREYEDPADRRFHAQPNACPACGPTAWLEDADGERLNLAGHTDAVAAAADLIAKGRIVAIKGIGGFHLACDAGNEDAVTELRRRKQRDGKAFALMARDVAMVGQYAALGPAEAAALGDPAAPIVLMERLPDTPALAGGIAPGKTSLGFMLPYSPLHQILLQDVTRPVVMTSGNLHDEPQAIDNQEARTRLAGIADAWLMHDRDIVNRVDDSVVRVTAGAARTVRRARGFAPSPLTLPAGFSRAPRILALGAELKNTFCLVKDGAAVLSQHMGDQQNPLAHADLRRNVELYRDLNQFAPELVAVDMHPDYLPSQWGRTLAEDMVVPIVAVQHHHAHVAAVMAEHGLPVDCDPVLGLVLDGLGLGEDGGLWGGEFMLADYRSYRHVGHFAAVPLIGGDKAMVQPWRNTFAHLEHALGWPEIAAEYAGMDLIDRLQAKPLATFGHMLARGINVPPARSAGRVFDAVAAALGLRFDTIAYEGEAAILLENLARQSDAAVGEYPVAAGPVIEWPSLWRGILADLKSSTPPPVIARRFHNTLIRVLSETAHGVRRDTSIHRVVLSGGVFQNAILLAGLADILTQSGFEVLAPAAVPANDGGIALGQAAIAAARHFSKVEA